MKLLVFSDMHGSKKALAELIRKAKRADLVLCCGDISIFEQDMPRLLKGLDSMKKPVLILPGNHEHGKRLLRAIKKTDNLIYMDAKLFETTELLVFGLEGNGFSIVDPEFDKISGKFVKMIKSSKKKYVLMTHAPPYSTRLDQLWDGHCGNKSVRKFIKKTKPIYAFSGHIHENSGKKDRINDTIVLNGGPLGKIVTI